MFENRDLKISQNQSELSTFFFSQKKGLLFNLLEGWKMKEWVNVREEEGGGQEDFERNKKTFFPIHF